MKASYFQYWGKAKKGDSSEYHLLPYHCLDVVAVADIWLSRSSTLLAQVSSQTGLEKEKCRSIILFFIALHDLGKFDARFQNFVPSLREKLQGNDYGVDNESYNHGAYGYYYFSNEFIQSSDSMKAVAGHHGFCDTSINFMSPDADEELIKQDQQARREWVEFCLDWFGLEAVPEVDKISMLAGLCSVSDWVGSSMTNFIKEPVADLQKYYQNALRRAQTALDETGMLVEIQGAGFDFLFSQYKPRGIQTLLPQLPVKAGLTIIESDTGSGKTEFALTYASILIRNGLADGVVFGLPTQATANGLFVRIGEAAQKLFSDSCVTLAHSKAKFLIPDENGFLHQSSKRAFLGSMSVATVDQILMGVLGIKHQFVRSFGTRKSVLILDEVHSYDAYMVGLIQQVLKGQHEAYANVILLSATLPQHLKNRLLESYSTEMDDKNIANNAYPLVTHVDMQGCISTFKSEEEKQSKKVLTELWSSPDLLPNDEQCKRLTDWAERGAIVGVICNTVLDAQILYSILSKQTEVEVELFHARFTVKDRRRIEDRVLKNYDKSAHRKGRLLVATQVIEQSLDLDFDVLVSQISPIEFLMQRMGRLWRHERNDKNSPLSPRNPTIKAPLFVTLCPDLKDVEANLSSGYGTSAYVYKNIRVLYRTQKFLLKNTMLIFPSCYRTAINKVHAPDAEKNEPDDLLKIVETFNKEQEGNFYSAIAISNQQSRPLIDVDPRAALLTREGEMSQSVVLFKEGNHLWHGGTYLEQHDRELNTVALSKKQAKGKKDEENYCLKAIVGTDICYSELGVYDERLQEYLAKRLN